MASLHDLLDPARAARAFDPARDTDTRMTEAMRAQAKALATPGMRDKAGTAHAEYLRDAGERMILTAYAYEKLVDGADLPFPSNYELLRILPPEGVTIDDARRPFIIIDPRAGHDPGIGNRLVKNEARLEADRPVDLKAIRSPIIVFASHGDNITPPQQALNWITETYADVQEIRIRGQRIVYMVHDQVGYLGIFVSGSVARREHSEMTSTLATIEALAPGLYEMVIEDIQGEGTARRFTVSFAERGFDDIRALNGPPAIETLPGLLRSPEERDLAIRTVFCVPRQAGAENTEVTG